MWSNQHQKYFIISTLTYLCQGNVRTMFVIFNYNIKLTWSQKINDTHSIYRLWESTRNKLHGLSCFCFSWENLFFVVGNSHKDQCKLFFWRVTKRTIAILTLMLIISNLVLKLVSRNSNRASSYKVSVPIRFFRRLIKVLVLL